MIIDDVMPVFDERSVHKTTVAATPDEVFAALLSVDLGDDRLIRLLFRIRGLPGRGATLDRFHEVGFTELSRESGRELVLGIIGRFWTPTGGLLQFHPDEFSSFSESGYAKAVWSFTIAPHAAGSALATETRVSCNDDTARRRFRRYWLLVKPLSGLIRRRMLALVARRSEAAP